VILNVLIIENKNTSAKSKIFLLNRKSMTVKSNTENAYFGQAYPIGNQFVSGTDICVGLKIRNLRIK